MIKKSFVYIILIAFLILPSAFLYGDSLGISPMFANLCVNDKDGNTNPYNGLQFLSFIYLYDLTNSSRLTAQISYHQFTTDADRNHIGQKVRAYQSHFIYQKKLRLSRHLNFYTGIGAGVTVSEFKSRHTKDIDGFLGKRFSDQDNTFYSVIINISKEWNVSKHIDMGLTINYEHAFQEQSFSGLKPMLKIFYTFQE